MASSGEAVRHIVVLKVANKEDKEKVAARLRKLEKGIPGVTFLSFNVVTDLGLVESNADVAVIADFPDKENYLAYASNPQHVSVVAENKPYIVGRNAIQFTPPKL